jgi:transcriptional regulator with XRE-family HTH domain
MCGDKPSGAEERMGRPARPLTPNVSAAHLFGAELRRAREKAGWSLEQLRDRCREHGRVLHRGWLAHVEHGERLPEDRDFAELADLVLGTDGLLTRLWEFAETGRAARQDETRQSRMLTTDLAAHTLAPIMNGDIVYVPYIASGATVAYMRMTRRSFLATGGLATASLASGLFVRDDLAVADDIAADILAGDPRRVATEQTSHAIDLTIASLISAGGMRPTPLANWMSEGDPVLRVNAAGIAAKMPGSDLASRPSPR